MKKVITILKILLAALVASLTVAFLIYPEKAMIVFSAHQLGYPSIVYINALFWVYPLIILRKGILRQNPEVNFLTFLIPCLIIIFFWMISYTGFLRDSCALGGTVIVSLLPWEELTIPTSKGIGNLFIGNKQLATIGGTDSVSKLAVYGVKLIPSSFNMEEDTTGSKKRSLSDSPSEQSGISQRPRLASTSPVLGSNSVVLSGAQSGLTNSFTSSANPTSLALAANRTLPALGASRTLPALGASRTLPVSASNRQLIASAENVKLPPIRAGGDEARDRQEPTLFLRQSEVAISWEAPYNWDMERIIKGRLLTKNAELTEILNILRSKRMMAAASYPLNKDQINLLHYLHFRSTGEELTNQQFRSRQIDNDVIELAEKAKTDDDKYINKLHSTGIESYFANPLFKELRLLEKVHNTLIETSSLHNLKGIIMGQTERGYVVDALQKEARTASASPLNAKNTFLAKTVIENRINELKEQLNLKE